MIVEEYKGYTIRIVLDEEPQNPRREFDHLGKMLCFHNAYDLGDKHDYHQSDYSNWGDFLRGIKQREGNGYALPLYLMDHSGLTISTGAETFEAVDSEQWEWGQVGWIFVSRDQILTEFESCGWKIITNKRKEHILRILREEVAEYDMYLRGDVYGYEVVNSEGEFVDSCWGFYGYYEKSGLLEAARDIIDGLEQEGNIDKPAPEQDTQSLAKQLLKDITIEEGALDELIHDMKAREASDINNAGLEAQVEYLIESCGAEGAKEWLKEVKATESDTTGGD